MPLAMLANCSVLFICLTVAFAAQRQPNYAKLGDCRSSDDCGPSKCCVIGMMRYSAPWCMPLLQLGDTCRPSSTQLTNTTLTYPGGLGIFLKDAYQVLCPCDVSQGLVCSTENGMCVSDDLNMGNDIFP